MGIMQRLVNALGSDRPEISKKDIRTFKLTPNDVQYLQSNGYIIDNGIVLCSTCRSNCGQCGDAGRINVKVEQHPHMSFSKTRY